MSLKAHLQCMTGRATKPPDVEPPPTATVVDGEAIVSTAGPAITITAGQALRTTGGSVTGGPVTGKSPWFAGGSIARDLGEVIPDHKRGGPGVWIQDGTAVVAGGVITGSTLDHPGIGLLATGRSTIQITGGTLHGHRALHYSGSGALEIAGGLLRSSRTLVKMVADGADSATRAYARTVELGSYALGLELFAGATATVSGGVLQGTVGSLIAHLGADTRLTISGGTLGGTITLRLATGATAVFTGRSLSLDRQSGLQVLRGILSDGSPINAVIALVAGRLVGKSPDCIVFTGEPAGFKLQRTAPPSRLDLLRGWGPMRQA